MKTYIGVMLAAACALSVGAGRPGETDFVEARGSVKPVRLPPGGPTPRMADGKSTSPACGSPGRPDARMRGAWIRDEAPRGPDSVSAVG